MVLLSFRLLRENVQILQAGMTRSEVRRRCTLSARFAVTFSNLHSLWIWIVQPSLPAWRLSNCMLPTSHKSQLFHPIFFKVSHSLNAGSFNEKYACSLRSGCRSNQ